MNTLEEVIEIASDWTNGFDEMSIEKKMLHYLKEYKNVDENYKRAISHVTEVIDHYEKMVADYLSVNNPALTWDELKLMEGKPLWVEEYYYNGQKKSAGWWLVDTQDDEQIVLRDQAGNPWYAYFISMGTDWKAYRKEIDHE